MAAPRVVRPALRTESLLKLVWPIFVQNMSNSLVVLVDFYFLSRLGDAEAGTIGQLLPLFTMGAFVIIIFAAAGISVASQFMGAGQDDKVVPTYLANLAMAGTIGLAYAAVLGGLSDRIGGWMGLPPNLSPIADGYLASISGYFVFIGVLGAYNAVLSSRGMTHWLMYTSFLVAGVNFVLDPLLAFGLGWGVRGIATASVAGAAVAASVAVYLVHRRLGISFRLSGSLRKVLDVLPTLLRMGVGNALEPFSYSCQQTYLSTFVIPLGVTAMAANNYSGRSHMPQITFAFSLATGCQILAAHWMGAGRSQDVERLFWRVIRLSCAVSLAYALLLWVAAPTVLGVFTEDPSVVALGESLLVISLIIEPARAVNIVGGFTLKAVGDTRFPAVVGFFFIWAILPIIYGVDQIFGLTLRGLWICFAADEAVRAVINLWRWRTGRWKTMAIAHRDTASPARAEQAPRASKALA